MPESVVIVTKSKCGTNKVTGTVHLTFEVLLPAGQEEWAKHINDRMNKVMAEISGNPPISEENYYGEEAQYHDDPIEDFFHRKESPLKYN